MKALCDVFIGDDTLQHLRVLERWFWIGLAPLRKVAYHREDSEPGDYSEDLEEDKRIREELEAFNQA